MRYTDPSGNYLCTDLACQAKPSFYLWSLPTISGPVGDEQGYKQAYTALQILAYEQNAWWGKLESHEAIGIFIYGEFTFFQEDAELEAVTRKYHEYCNIGIWSSRCLNSFWGYAQAWLDMPNLIDNYRQNDLTRILGGEVLELAISVMNPTNHPEWLQGEDPSRPGHWATLYRGTSPRTFEEADTNRSLYSYSYRRDMFQDDIALTLVMSWNQKAALCVNMAKVQTCSLAVGMPRQGRADLRSLPMRSVYCLYS